MYTFRSDRKKWLLTNFVSWFIEWLLITALVLAIVHYFPYKRLQESYIFILIFFALLGLFNRFYRDHVFKIIIDTEMQRIFFHSYRIIDGVSDFSLVAQENLVTFIPKRNNPDVIESMLFSQGKKKITWVYARQDGFTEEDMQGIAEALKKTSITTI
ncbi:MAG: hypothetical protein J0I41_09565 [Filimonas sp.]|nr:hypothetical protein [Filimonas sp.]